MKREAQHSAQHEAMEAKNKALDVSSVGFSEIRAIIEIDLSCLRCSSLGFRTMRGTSERCTVTWGFIGYLLRGPNR